MSIVLAGFVVSIAGAQEKIDGQSRTHDMPKESERGAGPGNAQLLFYYSEICEYCEKWDEEIGVLYNKTNEGKVLPLRRVDADEDVPEDLAHIGGIYFTPTFIAHRNGREVARIVGYINEDFFWGYLQPIVEKVRLADAADADKDKAATHLIKGASTEPGNTCVAC